MKPVCSTDRRKKSNRSNFMRHLKRTAKLGRTFEHRNAMLANMVCSLIKHKRITTTLAKAKAARSVAEKNVTKKKARSKERALVEIFDPDYLASAFLASPSAFGAGAVVTTSSTHSRMALLAESPGRCSSWIIRV